MSTDLSPREPDKTPSRRVNDVLDSMDAIKAIRTYVQNQLRESVDYGKIPGVAKNTLLQPGAQSVANFLRVYPEYLIAETRLGDDHAKYTVTCILKSMESGRVVGSGVGLCTTKETKYAYRKARRTCPACGAPAINKGKDEWGGGWYCNKKADGCGAKFRDGDSAIEDQEEGTVPNPNVADTENTVLKMACKRAFVSAIITIGCLSELFTQDMEDLETFDLRPAQQAKEKAEREASKPAKKKHETFTDWLEDAAPFLKISQADLVDHLLVRLAPDIDPKADFVLKGEALSSVYRKVGQERFSDELRKLRDLFRQNQPQ